MLQDIGITLILITVILICGFRIHDIISMFKKIDKKTFWIIYCIVEIFFAIVFALRIRPFAYIGSIWFIFTAMFSGISLVFKYIFVLLKKELFTKQKLILEGSIVIFIVIFTIIGIHTATDLKITKYNITSEKLEKLNIVVLSDVHLGGLYKAKQLEKAISKVKSLKPDIIIIPGDFFDRSLRDVDNLNKVEELLTSINIPIYATFGNHENLKEYNKMKDFFKSTNVILLDDEQKDLDEITLIGRKDKRTTDINDLARKKVKEYNYDENKFIIVIDHEPNDIKAISKTDADLLISGHTHDGQVFPLNILLIYTMELSYGYKNINNTNIIVSSGAGYTRLPIRLGTKSEIVQIIIN